MAAGFLENTLDGESCLVSVSAHPTTYLGIIICQLVVNN